MHLVTNDKLYTLELESLSSNSIYGGKLLLFLYSSTMGRDLFRTSLSEFFNHDMLFWRRKSRIIAHRKGCLFCEDNSIGRNTCNMNTCSEIIVDGIYDLVTYQGT